MKTLEPHSLWIFLLAIHSNLDSFEYFDLPHSPFISYILKKSNRNISLKEILPTPLALLYSSSSTLSHSLTLCTPCTWSKFLSFLLNFSKSIQDYVDALLAYEMHSLHMSSQKRNDWNLSRSSQFHMINHKQSFINKMN